jgi:flagellar biosynthetic protein FliR
MPDLANWLFVFVRIGGLLTVFPVFSAQHLPTRLRLALGVFIALLVAPALPPVALDQSHFLGLVSLLAKEIGVGLLFGFVSRMVFYALEVGGGIISVEMGLNMASSFNPFNRDRSEAAGLIVYYLAAITLLSLDLHHWLLLGFQKTYTLLPIGAGALGPALFGDIVGRTSQIFAVGLLMAAPVLAVTFLINLILSVLGRAVPQMNVFMESFAFRILGGLAVFGLTLNLMAQHIANYLRRLPEDVLRVAQLLGVG